MTRHSLLGALGAAMIVTLPLGGQDSRTSAMRDAVALDLAGKTEEARVLFQRLIDDAPTPADRAAAQRAMAMSWAFDGDCANTIKYEELVIAYWKTREAEEPQNAFYQQGEMANEGARVCIDAGDLDTAERYYRLGFEMGNREPAPRTHPASLWDYRLAHALGRIAARRGQRDEAWRQIAAARGALDGDPAMAGAQERFFPYLVGYVAFFTGELEKAEAEFTKAIDAQGGGRDPFFRAMRAVIYQNQGKTDLARAEWQQAYDLATSHNPPAAFAKPLARHKLGID